MSEPATEQEESGRTAAHGNDDDIVAKILKAKNSYLKHLCECKCVLPQYMSQPTPMFHQFVVFSVLNADMDVVPSMVKCNFCGAVSRVVGAGQLEPRRVEHSAAIESIEEIRDQLPENLISKIGAYADSLDIATWQEIRHVLEHDFCWGVCPIVITHEDDQSSGTSVAKVLNILGKTIYNIRTVTIN